MAATGVLEKVDKVSDVNTSKESWTLCARVIRMYPAFRFKNPKPSSLELVLLDQSGNATKRSSVDYVEACISSALKKKKLPANDSEVALKDKNAMEFTVMSEGSVKVDEVALNETNTVAFGMIRGSMKLNEVAFNNSIDYTSKPDAQNK
ncbi:hypothetical protein RIF29_00518 [Crotalaria pallida]|uniref:Replication protein A 70 kDa DNA-binding subunit B/D first OB fold domain-containing protein n=1 Tax=Crotalaria pallida TaxID=3830 RepID=A0AAN9P6J8_CROPI